MSRRKSNKLPIHSKITSRDLQMNKLSNRRLHCCALIVINVMRVLRIYAMLLVAQFLLRARPFALNEWMNEWMGSYSPTEIHYANRVYVLVLLMNFKHLSRVKTKTQMHFFLKKKAKQKQNKKKQQFDHYEMEVSMRMLLTGISSTCQK